MNEKNKGGRPRSNTSGRVVRYIRAGARRNYKHQFELPSLWFNYLSMNCERYRFELDVNNRRIIISVPTLEEIDKELERRTPKKKERVQQNE